MQFRILVVFLTVLGLAVIGSGQTPRAGTEPSKGYMIGPGDEITGKVLGEEQFDFVTTVDENGKLEVPFFETPINAKCLTERELRIEITKLLSKFLKSPQLNLRVTDRKSRPPVSIYGEVRSPQKLDLTRRAYLLELIAYSGGVTEKSGGSVEVFHTRAPLCEASPSANWKVDPENPLGAPSQVYSLTSLTQSREGSNPEIFPGDVILVRKAASIYVTGEVIRPGELSIPEEGLPLTQAIAMSSGITREAKTKNVKIYRRKSGASQPEVVAVNYDQIKKGQQKDVMLEPFDIIEVDKAKKSIGDILLEAVTGIPGRLPIPIRPF